MIRAFAFFVGFKTYNEKFLPLELSSHFFDVLFNFYIFNI